MSTERLNIDRRKKVSVDLNIAPLIDVVFQLLLFFALTSYFVSNPGIEVALPKAGSALSVEKNHIVILGWSEQVFTIISELMYANANQPYFCIAILGPLAKEDMEDQIRKKITKIGKTKIVCRTGDPLEMSDLKIVSLNTAKTIIILQPQSRYPDADVIKIVLAILNHPDRHPAPYPRWTTAGRTASRERWSFPQGRSPWSFHRFRSSDPV